METQAFLKILFWNLCLVNDLSSYLSSRAKLFVDYTSLFPVTHDITTSANELNNDLKNINYQAFQWKMSFNPRLRKQAQLKDFLIHLLCPTHSVRTPLALYYSLCSTFVTYGMPCYATGHQVLSNLTFLWKRRISLGMARILRMCLCPNLQFNSTSLNNNSGLVFIFVKIMGLFTCGEEISKLAA